MKLKFPWMSRADRRRWTSARTVTDLGELMALWLEGEIASRPGYAARYGPDEETEYLVPSLAALCRAGYITTQSQPGSAGTGENGLWWEQRAAVELVVADPELLPRLVDAANSAGMVVRVNDYRRGGLQDEPVIVTTCDCEAVTAFAGRISREDMAVQWPELNRSLYDQVAHGTYVSIIAPEYGAAGDRLWVLLDQVSGLRPAPDPEDDPWSDEPPWHTHGALEPEPGECTLCGAPLYHHRGPYCSKACEEADADDTAVRS
ncbi:hypothetical protein OG413_46740 [Streptomyces sp. NBC_01433]|uniref:DUF6919 domain-containing protein n=1 Tax=Streptomyces sp. NBC_01433 TaxID=2903864 RepID=UPI00224E5DB6|nr:hypothetical protein [Streptomyces sp. NBC_01433]MCX4682647.1 hypothetical protein [Streptomyces sp. NBC_01433]MCX4682687.1 hypothetical protein [Streptomyces sp. NBC_01433]